MKAAFAALIVLAAGIETPLANPAEEARAQRLMLEIRCVACENEPISQSGADIAGDMRKLVREQIEAGKSDAEIRTWFSDRYGDFVLFRPTTEGVNALLWAFPALALVLGGLGALALRRRPARTVESVPPEDRP